MPPVMPSPTLLNRVSRELPLYPCIDQRSAARRKGRVLGAFFFCLAAAALTFLAAWSQRW